MKTIVHQNIPVLIANVNGKFYAIGAICKHEDWDLSEGILEDHHVTCGGHGAIWDLETGEADYVEPLEKELIFEVRTDGDYILLSKDPLP